MRFDVSDEGGVVDPSDDEDEITQKYDLPDEGLRSVATAKVADAFEQFWPDHSQHELIGQTMCAGEVILTCTDCNLRLHVPSSHFVTWLVNRK